MNYFVWYDNNQWDVLNDDEFKNFIEVEVIHNKDISEFCMITLDSRLKKNQAKLIANVTGFVEEIDSALKSGDSPLEAVMEWIK